MRWLLTLIALFLPVNVGAQGVEKIVPLPPLKPEIRKLCQELTHHVPGDDVNFVAGRDDVVPADLGGGQPFPALIDPLRIPIQAPIGDLLAGTAAEGLAGDIGSPPLAAVLEVYQDGRVLYNGRDVSKQTFALCNRDKIVVDRAPVTPEASGQQGNDTLQSPKVKAPETIELREGIEGEILEGQYP